MLHETGCQQITQHSSQQRLLPLTAYEFAVAVYRIESLSWTPILYLPYYTGRYPSRQKTNNLYVVSPCGLQQLHDCPTGSVRLLLCKEGRLSNQLHSSRQTHHAVSNKRNTRQKAKHFTEVTASRNRTEGSLAGSALVP